MSQKNSRTSTVTFIKNKSLGYSLSRRELITKGLALGGSFLVGSGFIAASSGSWAMEVKSLSPDVMATLVQMARDVYPHDRFGDDLYALAVKGHDDSALDNADFKAMLEAGVESLNNQAQAMGYADYVSVGWEAERVDILKSMEDSEFFQTIRGGLVVGLYNQPAVWGLLGYEGSSFEKGGYIDRGFDDVNWL